MAFALPAVAMIGLGAGGAAAAGGTAAAVSSGLALAGAGVSAIGSIASGEGQAAMQNYQAQVAKNNAAIANQNAGYAGEAGSAAVTDVGLRARSKLAALTTGMAANQIDVNTGSAARARASQRMVGSLDEERAAQKAALAAYGYRTQASNFAATAGLDQAAAGQDVEAGFVGAAGNLLSSASSLGFKWAGLQKNPAAIPSAGNSAGDQDFWSG